MHVLLLFFVVGCLQLVEFPELVLVRDLLIHDFGIGGIIDQAFDHAFVLCHSGFLSVCVCQIGTRVCAGNQLGIISDGGLLNLTP